VEIGFNRTFKINCLVGKIPFAIFNEHHRESNIKRFQRPLTKKERRKIAKEQKNPTQNLKSRK
jgi:hypothetical protein